MIGFGLCQRSPGNPSDESGRLALFSEACGSADPLLLSIERPGAQQEPVQRVFQQPFVLVGRAAQADLPLTDLAVSLRHAYLQVIAGRVFYFDLRSRTGIRLNGQPAASGWLDRDQPLDIGPYRIRLLNGSHEGSATTAHHDNPLLKLPVEQDPLPGVSLEVAPEGTSTPTSWRMNRALAFVGQAAECKLRLASAGPSKFQCSLLRTPSGLWVIDLLSEEGIRVNGRRVPWARLADGDQLHVGNVTLRARYDVLPGSGLFPAMAVREWSGVRDPGLPDSALGPCPSTRKQSIPGRITSTALAPLMEPLLMSAGLPAERNEGTSLAIILVNQFALMQQQMFDQMTQATMMMAQMFGQMQDNQMQLIREELGHLHELTKELHALQADLLKHPRAARQPAAPQPAAGRTEGERTTPAPTQNESRAGAQHGPSLRGRTEAVERTRAAAGAEPGANPRTPTPLVAAAGQSQEDIHAVLCARIEALQQDRQSRWQSILHFMTGKRSTGSTSPAE